MGASDSLQDQRNLARQNQYAQIKPIMDPFLGQGMLLRHLPTKQIHFLKQGLIMESPERIQQYWKRSLKAKHSLLLSPVKYRIQESEGMCSVGDQITVVMQYELSNLQKRIVTRAQGSTQYFQRPEIWKLLYQTTTGLTQLTSHNIKHGDIRPHQIYVSQQQDFKLMNQEILRRGSNQTIFVSLGNKKDCFLAPELFSRLKNFRRGGQLQLRANRDDIVTTDKADVFSLGLSVLSATLLKNIQSQIYNFQTFTINREMLMAFLQEVLQLHGNWLYKVLSSMLVFDPQQRPSSSQVLKTLVDILDLQTYTEKIQDPEPNMILDQSLSQQPILVTSQRDPNDIQEVMAQRVSQSLLGEPLQPEVIVQDVIPQQSVIIEQRPTVPVQILTQPVVQQSPQVITQTIPANPIELDQSVQVVQPPITLNVQPQPSSLASQFDPTLVRNILFKYDDNNQDYIDQHEILQEETDPNRLGYPSQYVTQGVPAPIQSQPVVQAQPFGSDVVLPAQNPDQVLYQEVQPTYVDQGEKQLFDNYLQDIYGEAYRKYKVQIEANEPTQVRFMEKQRYGSVPLQGPLPEVGYDLDEVKPLPQPTVQPVVVNQPYVVQQPIRQTILRGSQAPQPLQPQYQSLSVVPPQNLRVSVGLNSKGKSVAYAPDYPLQSAVY